MSRAVKASLGLLWVCITALPPTLIALIATDHNPQNEFVSAQGAIHWMNLLPLIVAPAVIGFLLGAFVVGAVAVTMRVTDRKPS